MRYKLALISLDDDHPNQKVECIKAIRGFTGLGLRDSKQVLDNLLYGAKTVTLLPELSESDYCRYLEMANKGGLTIIPSIPDDPRRKEIKEQITSLVTYATISAQYDVSKALIKILEDYFPNYEKEPKDE